MLFRVTSYDYPNGQLRSLVSRVAEVIFRGSGHLLSFDSTQGCAIYIAFWAC
jgi:hypothetical protein